MKFSAYGFTFVELLVVIAVMGIIGVYTLSNFRSFGKDQNLKHAVLDVVSLLKQAETNAGTKTICNTQYGTVWQVEFSNAETVKLNCLESGTSTKKTLDLQEKNISISFSGTSCPSGFPLTINFAPLKAGISFPGYENCTQLIGTLTNGTANKSFKIETGGRIYAD